MLGHPQPLPGTKPVGNSLFCRGITARHRRYGSQGRSDEFLEWDVLVTFGKTGSTTILWSREVTRQNQPRQQRPVSTSDTSL